jgi:hypothetical protein
MRTLVATLALALVAALTPTPAAAQKATAGLSYAIEPLKMDPIAVTTGGAFDSGIIDGAKLDWVAIQFSNPDGATRSLIPACYEKTGTTALYTFPTTSVTSGSKVQIIMDPWTTTTTNVPTGTTIYSVRPCPHLKFTAAAASGSVQATVSGSGGPK